MKTKNALEWHQSFSAIPGPVIVPAGAPVEWNVENKCYYVMPSFFQGPITKSDAIHYGCRVSSDNVTKEYKDLTTSEKQSLLINCLIEDGASVSTADNVAKTDKNQDRTLRNVFGYTDDTEVD